MEVLEKHVKEILQGLCGRRYQRKVDKLLTDPLFLCPMSLFRVFFPDGGHNKLFPPLKQNSHFQKKKN